MPRGLLSEPQVLTSQQHLLQQVVNLSHAKELDELDLLYHLPGDALQHGQQQQQLPEAAPRVVLPVVDVILQAHLHLVPHPLDLGRVTQPLGICNDPHSQLSALQAAACQ